MREPKLTEFVASYIVLFLFLFEGYTWMTEPFRVFNIYRTLQIEMFTEELFTICSCVLHTDVKIENKSSLLPKAV